MEEIKVFYETKTKETKSKRKEERMRIERELKYYGT